MPDHAVIIVLANYNPRTYQLRKYAPEVRFVSSRYEPSVNTGPSWFGIFVEDKLMMLLRYDQIRGYIYVDDDPPDERILM